MISDLEDLYHLASLLNIRVIYKDLHARDPRLEGYAKPQRMLIVLDESLRQRPIDHVCVLAEEIGHMLYPPLYAVSYHLISFWVLDHEMRRETEYRHSMIEREALVWATSFLIPDKAFWNYYAQGKHEWWEWEDHFGVTRWFLNLKINYMKGKQKLIGKKLRGRDIINRTPPQGGF